VVICIQQMYQHVCLHPVKLSVVNTQMLTSVLVILHFASDSFGQTFKSFLSHVHVTCCVTVPKGPTTFTGYSVRLFVYAAKRMRIATSVITC